MGSRKLTKDEIEAGLKKWRDEGRAAACGTLADIRRYYGLNKAALAKLEAEGVVVSEGKMETYEHHGFMGRGNLHRVQKYVVLYYLKENM